MKIGIVGVGYVGFTAALAFAKNGFNVKCIDINEDAISKLKQGRPHIYEEGSLEILLNVLQENRLEFTTNYSDFVNDVDIILLCVGTPSDENGRANLTYLYSAVDNILSMVNKSINLVDKSTVPVGTAIAVKKYVDKRLVELNKNQLKINILSNPEFLREGKALYDFLNPDRVVIGRDNDGEESILFDIYSKFIDINRIVVMGTLSAEMTKYSSNCFLATKISFINEMAILCDKIGVDVKEVAYGMGLDNRIGREFLNAGIGFGGSCFLKDLLETHNKFIDIGENTPLLTAVIERNKKQRLYFKDKIISYFDDIKGKNLAIWGIAFKGGTDDVRDSPALDIVKALAPHVKSLTIYDPQALESASTILANYSNIYLCFDMYETLNKKDGLVILTEWYKFKNADYEKVKQLLKAPIVFDGKNLFSQKWANKLGLNYVGVAIYN